MHTCQRCDRDFATSRGLDTHLKRSHVVSDDWVVDFINLIASEQETVLCMAESLANDQGDVAFARGKYRDQKVREDALAQIVVGPIETDRVECFKEALTLTTGVEYRYIIQEMP